MDSGNDVYLSLEYVFVATSTEGKLPTKYHVKHRVYPYENTNFCQRSLKFQLISEVKRIIMKNYVPYTTRFNFLKFKNNVKIIINYLLLLGSLFSVLEDAILDACR